MVTLKPWEDKADSIGDGSEVKVSQAPEGKKRSGDNEEKATVRERSQSGETTAERKEKKMRKGKEKLKLKEKEKERKQKDGEAIIGFEDSFKEKRREDIRSSKRKREKEKARHSSGTEVPCSECRPERRSLD